MPKSSFICKKSGPAPILSPDPLLFLVYQIAQPYKESFCFFSKRRLLILIHPSILFNECQEPFEHLYPLLLQLSSIQKFPLMLNPVQHIMFLNSVLRRISAILLQKPHHFIVSHHPSFFLPHSNKTVSLFFSTLPSLLHISLNRLVYTDASL